MDTTNRHMAQTTETGPANNNAAEPNKEEAHENVIRAQDFAHLHLHSAYSLLDGALRIEDIPRLARKMGHKHVAITDHGNMFGAVAFYKACMAEGIHPIIGCEVYVAPGSRFDKKRIDGEAYHHLILLCENEVGYRNLSKLVSLGYTEGFYTRPRIDMELLTQYHTGLIALSACLAGVVPTCVRKGDFDGARAHAKQMRDVMGAQNYYLELQNHGMSEEEDVNRFLLQLSDELKIPMVATNDVHYAAKEDARAQRVLMCIQTNTTIQDDTAPIGFTTEEYYYKSTEEMAQLFADCPQALTNTVDIARRCQFDFTFGTFLLPTYPTPHGIDADTYLRDLAQKGFEKRQASGELDFSRNDLHAYQTRMAYELDIICKMGFAQYYLIVWDFIRYARQHGIPVGPGRGSGAGSLVAYLLEITQVDSMKYGLMFERFLNPERASMPDFDIDFCYVRRGEVITYVAKRYGAQHVAQIITFGTLAARAAIRDVGRVLGMSYAEVDAVARLIPRELNMTLSIALKQEALQKVYEENNRAHTLIDLAKKLEGLPRHISIHAAGVVITPQPVMNYVPLAQSGGVTVTQYDMDIIAQLGLLKFDFLGLRYLTVISDAEKMIQRTMPDFSVEKIPLDDEKTYLLIERGNTAGVFQLESAGMRRVLGGMQPRDLEGIVAAIALYRPGPMESIPQYIHNRQHPQDISYPIPALKPILDITYGCIVYQEQIMQICHTVAGYSLGRASMFAKKKWKSKEDERDCFVFGRTESDGRVISTGAVHAGLDEAAATALFEQMTKYSFNKSHAVAYAFLSYRTAYLKCHFPAQYFCSLLSSVQENTEKMGEYIADAAAMGIPLLSPDINESDLQFTVVQRKEGFAIRFGLCAIKNIGEPFARLILEQRQLAPFRTFEQFIARMSRADLNKRQVEALIKAGAFDSMSHRRSQLMASYEALIDLYVQQRKRTLPGQLDLFHASEPTAQTDMADDTDVPPYSYPDIPEISNRQRLLQEREMTGQCFSGDFLDDYTDHIRDLHATPILEILHAVNSEMEAGGDTTSADPSDTGFLTSASLPATSMANTAKGASSDALASSAGKDDRMQRTGTAKEGKAAPSHPIDETPSPLHLTVYDHMPLTVCGIISAVQFKTTRKEETMAFLTLEDRFAHIEVVVFPSVYRRVVTDLQTGHAVGISGKLQLRDDAAPNLLAQQITPLYSNAAYQKHAAATQMEQTQQIHTKHAQSATSKKNTGGMMPVNQTKQKNTNTSAQTNHADTEKNGAPAAQPQKPRTLYLRLDTMDETDIAYQKTINLLAIFSGQTPVVLYDRKSGKYHRDPHCGVTVTDFILTQFYNLLGEENVILQ